MPENDQNLGGSIGDVDFSSIDVSLGQEAQNTNLGQGDQDVNQLESSIGSALGDISDVTEPQNQDLDLSSDAVIGDLSSDASGQPLGGVDLNSNIGEIDSAKLDLEIQNSDENNSGGIDESLFVESGDNSQSKSHSNSGGGRFGKYLRLFFFSSVLIILGAAVIVLLYLFNSYITEASKPNGEIKEQSFVDGFKEKFKTVKGFFGKDGTANYKTPLVRDDISVMNRIVEANDLDYIEKKDLLTPYVEELLRDAETNAKKVEDLKHDIARQGFLPDELDGILSKDQAIDTIQRSLNALEVIKFSTATKVYSYMDSALQTIADMVRVNGSSPEAIRDLFTQLNSRGEKDISSYVYMCYLNPFETRAGCDEIGDLDMYYKDLEKQEAKKAEGNPNYEKLEMIDIKLFKNAMSAIDQLLETEQTALFSITFNGFNAQDKNITFNIEVYTNQNDEKTLMEQGKKNPNIFILTSIVNLLKQSSFIIGAEISTKTVDVDVRTVDYGGFSMPVNYSNQEFTVPIQRSTEREIFDYIDLDNIIEKMSGNKESEDDVEKLDDINENAEAGEDEDTEIGEDEDTEIGEDEKTEIGEDEDTEIGEDENALGTKEKNVGLSGGNKPLEKNVVNSTGVQKNLSRTGN